MRLDSTFLLPFGPLFGRRYAVTSLGPSLLPKYERAIAIDSSAHWFHPWNQWDIGSRNVAGAICSGFAGDAVVGVAGTAVGATAVGEAAVGADGPVADAGGACATIAGAEVAGAEVA